MKSAPVELAHAVKACKEEKEPKQVKSRFFRDEHHPWIKKQEFKDLSGPELLSMIIERNVSEKGQEEGRPPAWVFDLDSTLFCTGPRLKNIYAEFLREHPGAPLLWQQILPRLQPQTQRYDLERTFRELLAETHAQLSESEARTLWDAFRHFWRERFFLSRHIFFDEPYEGAAAYVHAVAKAGFEIVYLTGRDRPRGYTGSRDALKRSGFPMGQHTHLVLKPHKDTMDLEFKARALDTLRRRFRIDVLIDNEPENLVMMAQRVPEAEIVLFHSIMSAREPGSGYREALRGRTAWRLSGFT